MGIRLEMGVKDTFLYGNQLNGEFDELFSGNVVPGPVQLTERRLRLSAATHEPAEFREIIRITNAGVLPVRIKPQVEASWLEAEIDSDPLTADQPLTALSLKLRPALDEGEYSTVVTIAPDGAAPVTFGVQVFIKPR